MNFYPYNSSVVHLLFALLFWAESTAQTPVHSALYGMGTIEYHLIEYQSLQQNYHIFIRLPEAMEAGKTYPTIYLLDGGMTFPLLSAHYRYLALAGEIPPAILVGISYGSADYENGNNRSRDFTAKSAERSYWGGADDFLTFFESSLLPLVEENYPSDPGRRIIFGQSLGGQFVLYAAQTSPNLFWGGISSNPALHRNLEMFLSTQPALPEAGKRMRLFVSSGSEDNPIFLGPAMKWVEHWRKQEDVPWELKCSILEGQNHFSATPEAFRQGMKWIFVGSEH